MNTRGELTAHEIALMFLAELLERTIELRKTITCEGMAGSSSGAVCGVDVHVYCHAVLTDAARFQDRVVTGTVPMLIEKIAATGFGASGRIGFCPMTVASDPDADVAECENAGIRLHVEKHADAVRFRVVVREG